MSQEAYQYRKTLEHMCFKVIARCWLCS